MNEGESNFSFSNLFLVKQSTHIVRHVLDCGGEPEQAKDAGGMQQCTYIYVQLYTYICVRSGLLAYIVDAERNQVCLCE